MTKKLSDIFNSETGESQIGESQMAFAKRIQEMMKDLPTEVAAGGLFLGLVECANRDGWSRHRLEDWFLWVCELCGPIFRHQCGCQSAKEDHHKLN